MKIDRNLTQIIEDDTYPSNGYLYITGNYPGFNKLKGPCPIGGNSYIYKEKSQLNGFGHRYLYKIICTVDELRTYVKADNASKHVFAFLYLNDPTNFNAKNAKL